MGRVPINVYASGQDHHRPSRAPKRQCYPCCASARIALSAQRRRRCEPPTRGPKVQATSYAQAAGRPLHRLAITQWRPCEQSRRTAAAPSAGAPTSRRCAPRAGQLSGYAQAAARLHQRLAHAPAPMLPFAERSQRAQNRRPRELPVRATGGARTRLCVHRGSGPSSSGAERSSGMLPLACALVRSAFVLRRAACPGGPARR